MAELKAARLGGPRETSGANAPVACEHRQLQKAEAQVFAGRELHVESPERLVAKGLNASHQALARGALVCLHGPGFQ